MEPLYLYDVPVRVLNIMLQISVLSYVYIVDMVRIRFTLWISELTNI